MHAIIHAAGQAGVTQGWVATLMSWEPGNPNAAPQRDTHMAPARPGAACSMSQTLQRHSHSTDILPCVCSRFCIISCFVRRRLAVTSCAPASASASVAMRCCLRLKSGAPISSCRCWAGQYARRRCSCSAVAVTTRTAHGSTHSQAVVWGPASQINASMLISTQHRTCNKYCSSLLRAKAIRASKKALCALSW